MDSLIALLIGLGGGLAFAWFDLKKGRFWYRAWYKLTHKEGLPEDSDLTFLKNQPFSARLVPAVLLSAIIGYIFFVTGELNFLVISIYAGLMFVGMMVSFYLFPFFMQKVKPQLGQVKNTIKKIDELEATLKADETVEKPEIEREEIKKEDKSKDENKGDWRSGVKDFLDK